MSNENNKPQPNNDHGQGPVEGTKPAGVAKSENVATADRTNHVELSGEVCQDRTSQLDHATEGEEKKSERVSSNKPGPSQGKMDSTTEEECEYDSEPASAKSLENKKKRRFSLKSKNAQGKTMYPLSKSAAREFRELAKKHFNLEKNLKIDGIPEQPVRKRRMSLNLGRDKDIQYKRKRLNTISVDRPKKGHMPNWGSFGGDATDPLNLNGLAHSEEGRLLNLKTPENSPLPTPDFRKLVFVKIPPNIEDPLNLEGKHDQGLINMLLTQQRKKRHRTKKNKDNANQGKELKSDSDYKLTHNESSSANERASEIEESPKLPIPQPKDKITEQTPQKQCPLPRPRSRSLSTSPDRKLKRQISGNKSNRPFVNEPKKFPEKPMFTDGNYNRYYGYRNKDNEPDPRLRYFHPSFFANKDILDIGCNVGHVTLAIAQHYHPKKILGMDIDGKLIIAARHNMRHILSRNKDSSKYPSVFEMTRGPIEAHPLKDSSSTFPNNVMFLQGNYVPGSEDILRLQKEEYDTILALSITKWIHLNNGDYGLKLFFQKIVRQLRPGGHLILEPQPWSTYRKRAKLTPEMFKNYAAIKLKPEGFKNYLLSIGFAKCEVIGVPVAKAKGFRRPLILFTKADRSNSSNPPTTHQIPSCTECQEGNQSECDHIQFTGMRRGAYADRMYDHIAYKPSLRIPDNVGGNASYSNSSTGRNHGPSPSMGQQFSYLYSNTYSPMMDIHPPNNMQFSTQSPGPLYSSLRLGSTPGSQRSEGAQSCHSQNSSGSSSSSGSSHSNQSSSSGSDSTSTTGNGDGSISVSSSTSGVSGSDGFFAEVEFPNVNAMDNVAPDVGFGMAGDNGPAEEIVWVNNELANDIEDNHDNDNNGDIDNNIIEEDNIDLPLPLENGQNSSVES